jgi:hypothetical protein
MVHRAYLSMVLQMHGGAVEEAHQDMSEMQQALIASEERRLEIGRALIEFKIEHNQAEQAAEEAKYELEQKVLDLEARLAQVAVTSVRSFGGTFWTSSDSLLLMDWLKWKYNQIFAHQQLSCDRKADEDVHLLENQ